VLVLNLDHAHRFTYAELRPELLRLAFAVVRDDGVRGAEDGVGRAVVLLQRDRARSREVALEVEDVVDVRSSEGKNRLVRIAHGAHIHVRLGQELQQPVLGVVRVLVLVDEDVAERVLPLLQRVREALEHVDREHQ
jgi:hypothetical protein